MSTQESLVHYRVDPAASRFTVRAFASGLLSAMGHSPTIAIRQYEGETGFVPDSLGSGFLRLAVHPDSFEVVDDVSAKDKRDIESKMKQEVLETSRFSSIEFESSNIELSLIGDARYGARINGNLALHGATRPLTIVCHVALNDGTLHATGEFSLRQSDYGMKPPTVAGGALKVKDELKFSFDIVARKEP